MSKYNKQILNLKESEIRSFNNFAKENQAELFLTLGEPDFFTPTQIKEKCKEAIDLNKTKYGPTPGLLELREKICDFEKKQNNIIYTPNEVIVTCGSTEAISAALFTIINPGDEVIVPIPAYALYQPMIEFAQGVFVSIDTSLTSFQITKEALEKAITPKTKALILTSPNNPTGTIYDETTLELIYQYVKNKDIFIICDECYSLLFYEGECPHFSKYQDIRDQIIICQSFSKPYAMPGFRIGYLLASEEFIYHASKIHQYMTVACNTFIQYAAIEALDFNPKLFINEYKQRRDYVYNRLIQMGFEVIKPQGAFYIFPSIKKFGLSSLEFCKRLVYEKKVAFIPGSAFKTDDYVRISYCVDMATIIESLNRLEDFIKTLKNNPV